MFYLLGYFVSYVNVTNIPIGATESRWSFSSPLSVASCSAPSRSPLHSRRYTTQSKWAASTWAASAERDTAETLTGLTRHVKRNFTLPICPVNNRKWSPTDVNTFHWLFCVNQSEHATNRKPLFQQTFCLKHAIQSLSVREQAQMDVLSLSRDTACRGRCNTHTHRVLTSICKKKLFCKKLFFAPKKCVCLLFGFTRGNTIAKEKKLFHDISFSCMKPSGREKVLAGEFPHQFHSYGAQE